MSLQKSLPVHWGTFHPLRFILLSTALLLAIPGLAQYLPSKSQFPSQRGSPPQTNPVDDLGGNDPQMKERRLEALSESRHKSIVKDTQKLLDLATELNHEIQSAHPASLTPAQLRKLGEIEKLARHVEAHMRQIVQLNPPSPPSAP